MEEPAERIEFYYKMAKECYRNARSLYRDARLLEQKESRGHAYSLAVLGIEETIKSLIYRWASFGLVRISNEKTAEDNFNESDLRHHLFKHTMYHQFIYVMYLLKPVMEELNTALKGRSGIEKAKKAMLSDDFREYVKKFVANPENLHPELKEFFENLSTLDNEKNRGFYVDCRKNNRVIKPNQLPDEKLEYWLVQLKGMLQLADISLKANYSPEKVRMANDAIVPLIQAIIKESMENQNGK